MTTTAIVLADDHQVVRRGLRSLLEEEPDFRIVGEASNGLEAAELVERLKPDVLVVDVIMPGLTGLEVARRAGQDSPHTRVVVLSIYDNDAYVLEALRAGAKAYVLKRSTSDELVYAIREAIAGRHYIGSPLPSDVPEAYVEKARGMEENLYETLTAREREVLHLTAEGCTSSEIAARLSISSRTAEHHRARLMHKLGLHTRSDLIRYALRRGILLPEG